VFTLGGKTNSQLGFEVLKYETKQPGLPDTRDRLMYLGGRHGAYDFGADLRPQVFFFHSYFITAVTPAEIQTALRALSVHLLDAWGRPKRLSLVFDAEPDKTYFVRYSGSFAIDDTASMNRRRFTLPLLAPEPYAYGSAESEVDTLTVSPDENTYEIISQLNVPLTIIMDNIGANTVSGFSFKTYDIIFDHDLT
jgi:phage-related protein